MNTKIITIILLSIFITIAIFVACETKPTKPEYNNVFDPGNPATSGDPFQLQVSIGNGGVNLAWTNPAAPNLANFKIYRSEQEETGYSELGTVAGSQTQYTDQTVQNGHSYWYRVAAVNSSGNETGTTNISAINIKTEPVLLINNGDEYTPTKEVNLTILANTAQQMMLSNTSDFSGVNWETYATSKPWTLLTGEGEKIVYMKVQYNDGSESPVVHNSILLDTTSPIPALVVSPDSGITNETTFQYDPTAGSDNLAPIVDMQVRFDWENDGNWDTNWQQLFIVNKQYTIGGGDKTVKMQIQDGAGWTADTTAQVFVNTRPIALFTATQAATNTSLFHFDASASSDYEDGTNLNYRWDFDGDGGWETSWLTQDTISFLYSAGGDYSPKLSVRDLNNLTAEITVSTNVFDGTVTDIDGNIYLCVKIGNQWWMAENLKVTHYRNGDAIPQVMDNGTWTSTTGGAYCAYNNDNGNVATYGLLYNWYAAADSRNIAPAGWHVPKDGEWKELEMYLGMSLSEADAIGWRGTDEGGKLKEAGTTHWSSPSTGATNSSGFTALPSGYRSNGIFYDIGEGAGYWTSTPYSNSWTYYRHLSYISSQVHRGYGGVKQDGNSIRCVRD